MQTDRSMLAGRNGKVGDLPARSAGTAGMGGICADDIWERWYRRSRDEWTFAAWHGFFRCCDGLFGVGSLAGVCIQRGFFFVEAVDAACIDSMLSFYGLLYLKGM